MIIVEDLFVGLFQIFQLLYYERNFIFKEKLNSSCANIGNQLIELAEKIIIVLLEKCEQDSMGELIREWIEQRYKKKISFYVCECRNCRERAKIESIRNILITMTSILKDPSKDK